MRRDVQQALIVMCAFAGAVIALGTMMWLVYG